MTTTIEETQHIGTLEYRRIDGTPRYRFVRDGKESVFESQFQVENLLRTAGYTNVEVSWPPFVHCTCKGRCTPREGWVRATPPWSEDDEVVRNNNGEVVG